MPTRSAHWVDTSRSFSSLTPAKRLWVVLSALLCAFTFTVTAHAQDLSGRWQAGSLRVSWSVGDWGKNCGPKPSGGGESGGTVTLTKKGAGFSLSGLGRNYQSNQCWEQMPGLATRTTSAGASAIQTMCTMPPGDPRKATVTTTWYPRGDELYFDETGQYQFVVSGSNCTASVRRTRLLKRILPPAPAPASPASEIKQPAVDAPATATASEKPVVTAEPPPLPNQAARCKSPGEATSLEVSPRTKLMRLGETFTFASTARDSAGCRVPVKTTWRLLTQSPATLNADGTLAVPKDAPVARLTIEAQVQGKKITVFARIVSDEEFEQLIAGGNYGVLGESLDTTEIELTSSHVELDDAPPTAATKKKSPLLWVLGAIIALLGVAVGLLLHRTRHHHAAPSSEGPAVASDNSSQAGPTVPLTKTARATTREDVQTTQSSAGTQKSMAVPAPQPAAQEPRGRRLCPVCGQRFEESTQFCPNDGARLMRVN